MKNNRHTSGPISPVSFNILANIAESTPIHTPAKVSEQTVTQVVFEVEFVKIFNDRAIGKIWFLSTSAQEQVKQGEGVVIIPIQPDASEKDFALQGREASIVANTYSDFGDVMAVVRGILIIDSLSTDDTAIKTGFGRIMVSHLSLNHKKICPRHSSPENTTFIN